MQSIPTLIHDTDKIAEACAIHCYRTVTEMYTFVADIWSMVCGMDNPCLYVNIQHRQHGTKKLFGEKRHA
jgi:hypothetical protein